MKQLHLRCHLVGTGTSIFGKSPSSSSSPAAVQLVYAHQGSLLLAHKISWKHLQESADSARLEEFNSAVRRSSGDMAASAAAHGGEVREREAVVSSSKVPVEPEETGEAISGVGVPAARSASVVDGPADSDLQPDLMASAGDGSCGGDGLEEEKATSVPIHVPTAAETGEVASASFAMASNGAICSPSRSAPATPPEDILGEGEWADRAIEAHRQALAPASGKVSAGDQDDCQSSPNPSGEQSPASSRTKTAEALIHSSGNSANGAANLYNLGLAAASAKDVATILSEVAKHVGLEAYHEQQPQRRAVRQRKAAAAGKAAPVCFSLRLSDEEATEDVAAVSLPVAVNPEAAPAPAVVVLRDRKRRRNRH